MKIATASLLVLLVSQAAIADVMRPIARQDATVTEPGEVRPAPRPAKLQWFKNTNVCGIAGLTGKRVASVTGKIRGCGIDKPVRITNVAGVKLSNPAVMDCRMAKSLHQFTAGSLRKAVGSYGGGVSEMRVVAHYACRTRNSRKGAKLSEHGKGLAIDIAGFTLASGDTMSVLKDWGKGKKGAVLRQIWKLACNDFGTVLGPMANAAHKDHFHFDAAAYRSGSYCR